MQSFSALDLQQRTGDIQRAAIRGPVLLTSHGKPRSIIMSAEEFRRLKTAAGELVSPSSKRPGPRSGGAKTRSVRHVELRSAVDQMVADVKSGRTREAVEAELEGVRRAYRGRAR